MVWESTLLLAVGEVWIPMEFFMNGYYQGGGSQTSGSGNDSFQIIFVAWKQILSIIAHCLQVDICNL